MAAPTQANNTYTAASAPQSAGEQANNQLPFVHEGTPEYKELLSNQTALRPYLATLQISISVIQRFINKHATSDGRANTQKTVRVLGKLNDYLRERVNCAPCDLKAITLNQHRTDLLDFAQTLETLSNPEEVSKGLSCAVEMAEGLGVCADGEYLNIHEQLIALKCDSTGLEKHIQIAKESLINQNLLALVRSEAAVFMDVRQARALEIHQVQTLRNAFWQKWGLEKISDKHANDLYAEQAGQMADELIEKTVTPAAKARYVAGALRECISTYVGSYDASGNKRPNGALTAQQDAAYTTLLTSKDGFPENVFEFTELEGLLQAEFGIPAGRMWDFLAMSDNGSTVALRSEDDIACALLTNNPDAFELKTSVGSGDNAIQEELGKPVLTAHDLLPGLKQKRDNTAAAQLWGARNFDTRWINRMSHVLEGTFHNPHELRDDERRRREELSARHGLPPPAAPTHQQTTADDKTPDYLVEFDPTEDEPDIIPTSPPRHST